MVTRLQTVPSAPAHYARLRAVLSSDNDSLQAAGEVIAQDPGMTAKILQLVHSSFFGPPRQVCDPAKAAISLGRDTLATLAGSTDVFCEMPETQVARCGLQGFWSHSHLTASFAQQIARCEGLDGHMVEEVRIGAFLHDIGQLLLASHDPQCFLRTREAAQGNRLAAYRLEEDEFGANHAKVGAYLLGLWGLPSSVVDVVAWHHQAEDYTGAHGQPLIIVCAANYFAHELLTAEQAPTDAHFQFLAGSVAAERLDAWREACRLMTEQGENS
jgi:putative nucleotidyltransferase with HDIG domain